MAPFLAALAKAGLPLLANAVLSVGKEVVEKELGVDIEELTASPEGLLKLKQLEFDKEKFLIEAAQKRAELALESDKLDNANTADSRRMNAEIQASANAAHLAKVAAYYLDFIIVLATVGLAYAIFYSDTKFANQELAYTAFGSLITMCGTILNFHRGTSRGSQDKNDILNKVSMRKGD
jgi:hypothetical protein